MTKHIVSLPIYPWENPTLSHIISPYVSNLIMKNIVWYESIIATNLLWIKTKNFSSEILQNLITSYENLIQNFWIKYTYNWIDKNEIASINEFFNQMVTKWYISEQKISVIKCECWCVEMIDGGHTYGSKKKLVENNFCKKCHTAWKKQEIEGLLFHNPWLEIWKIYPKKYASFMNNYNSIYHNILLLISRQRDTWITQTINGTNYNIDIDFIWSTWLSSLYIKWYNPSITVSNPSSLYNTYIGEMIYQIFSKKTIDTLVHPYVMINNNKESSKNIWLKNQEYNLNKIINHHEQEIYQLFISLWIKRTWEDITKVDIWFLKKIRKKLVENTQKPNLSKQYFTLEEFLQNINGTKLTNILNKKEWNKFISTDNSLLLPYML